MNCTIWIESLLISLNHLRTHPLRTILTIFGFTIGLASLIAMVGIGEGTRQKVIRDMERLGGANVISIQVSAQFLNNPAHLYDKQKKLSDDDLAVIRRASSHITMVAPTILKPQVFRYKNNRFRGSTLGTTNDYAGIRNWQVSKGRFITDSDIEHKKLVCVIGSEVRRSLFEDTNPIGKKIRFNKNDYQVIGIMADLDLEAGRWMNDLALIPVSSTNQQIGGKIYYTELFVKVSDIELVPLVKNQIISMLREAHGNFDNFRVFSQSDVIENLLQSSTLMSFTFGIISLIILFVGGIGIMNLMLVSVTERTREIGIYKAIGAKDSDIFRLFLLEAVFISCVGGCLGIVLGMKGSRFIVWLADLLLQNTIESIVSVKIIFVALAASILLGAFFGLYPALSAARVEPGRALRYE